MNKIRVIDLLNKIANGEEVPKNIKYCEYLWEYNKGNRDYIDQDGDSVFSCDNYAVLDMLNDEIEIIEESKKIEKLNNWCDVKSWNIESGKNIAFEEQSEYNKNLFYKINEIINYINSKEDK